MTSCSFTLTSFDIHDILKMEEIARIDDSVFIDLSVPPCADDATNGYLNVSPKLTWNCRERLSVCLCSCKIFTVKHTDSFPSNIKCENITNGV